MNTVVPGYYILDKLKKDSWFDRVKRPFSILNWTLFYLFRRITMNVLWAPDAVKLQKPVHVMFTTDDQADPGTAIVNLLPPKSIRSKRSYFDQTSPFFFKQKTRQLSFNKPAHKAYVDSMIEEIGRLLNGQSQQDKCNDKKFIFENIHIKGLERLDSQLANYFQEQVRQKYHQDFFSHPRNMDLNFYTLDTGDGGLLESVEVSNNKDKIKPMAERKFIISCMARNQNYIYWLKDFCTSATKIGCTVIGFNYRGIDFSKGMVWTEEDMVNDALAQAQRLIESGAKPENIAFEGMSVGGAIATIAAAKMHDKGSKVKLYNERSFRSIVRLMAGYVMPAESSSLWNPMNWLRYAVAGLSYLIMAPIIWLEGWHLDAASAWERIPYEDKAYAVACNQQKPDYYDDDTVRSYSTILSLTKERTQQIKKKQRQGSALSLEEQRLIADTPESHEFVLDRSNKINTNPSPHSAPRRFLFRGGSPDTTTMHDYMIATMRQKFGI